MNFQHGEQKIPSIVLALHESFAKVLNKVPKHIRPAFLLLSPKERRKLIRRLLPVAVALTTLSLTLFSFHSILGQSNQALSIGSQGIIKTMGEVYVGVYWDSSCSSAVSFINWTTVEPGSRKNVTIYVKNEGNDAVNVSIFAANWNPSDASNYLTLSCEPAYQIINPLEVVQTTLTLSTSSDIEGITDFSFDIIIYVS